MAMAGPIRMSTEADRTLLTLAQWFSPSFPIGAFSYSHGLERLVETGRIACARGFSDWMESTLRYGAGRNDLIFLAAAYRATSAAELAEIDARARAMAPSRERLLETSDQGEAFAATVAAVWGHDLPPLCYPVAAGAAAAAEHLPLQDTARMYLHAFLSAMTSAAIRLVPLGQTEGQSVILALTPLCEDLCASELDQPLDALGGSTFLADVAAMNHEVQYSRMFRT